MATSKDTAEYILSKLGSKGGFSVRPMFGEYALYCNLETATGKPPVVGLICDNTLYVKIMPESKELEAICEQDNPYPGAKLYYVISDDLITTLRNLPQILMSIAKARVKKTNK